MKKLVLTAMLALGLAGAGEAAPVRYYAVLDGASESPSVVTPGTGTAMVEIDVVAHLLQVAVEFQDLIGTTTASHIHCCTAVPEAGNAGVATQVPTFQGFPLGVSSGTYNHIFDLTLASSWNAAFITANGGTPAGAEAALAAGLDAGRAYLNIHTTFRPGGEIRGFLVPEPATMSLLGLGLAGLVAARRRRA